MFSIEAISINNGWAMSALGILIVFSGLLLLSLTVAQLHKILKLWDKKNYYFQQIKKRLQRKDAKLTLPKDIQNIAMQFELLIQRIGEPFPLSKLLNIAEKCGLPQPQSAINDLMTAQIIVSDGKGYFLYIDKYKG